MANGRKTGGRVAGTPNKINGDVKAMILSALTAAGGEEYLLKQAHENPTAFMTLLGKVLPLQVAGENGAPLSIDFRWADATTPVGEAFSDLKSDAVEAGTAGFVVTFDDGKTC